jgi:cobalt-zinc-cadmium efflux system outer membrane protein
MIAKAHTAAMGLLLLAGGCGTVPRQGGFADVQKVVAERTDKRVQWKQDNAADRAVSQTLRDILKHELTADAAVQIALLNNHRLQATYEELGIAQADLVEAGLFKNPTILFQRRFPGQATEIDVAGEFISLLLLPLRKKVAQAEFEATKQRVAHEVLNLAAEVRQAFFTAQASQQMLEMRRSIAAAADASADAAQKLHDAGNTKDVELDNELAQADQAKLDLAAAEADLLADRERLNRLMGLWGPDMQWTLSARLPELPITEVAPEGLESLAVSKRLDLLAARQEIEAIAQSLGVSHATGLVPELNVSGHYEREIDGNRSFGPAVELTVPIFNQGQPAIARAEARLRQSQQRYAALAVEIRSEVRAARDRMVAARSRADYYRKVILPRRHRITEETERQYNAMQVGVFVLLQARQAEIDAGREYIDALKSYWIARSDLEKAVGGRLKSEPATSQPTTTPSAPTQPRPSQAESEDHQHH